MPECNTVYRIYRFIPGLTARDIDQITQANGVSFTSCREEVLALSYVVFNTYRNSVAAGGKWLWDSGSDHWYVPVCLLEEVRGLAHRRHKRKPLVMQP